MFNCIRILSIPTPTGIDKVISEAQSKLSSVVWLTHIFGKAYLKKESNDGFITNIPKAWGGNNEYISLLPCDDEKAFCFFESFEDENVTGYEAGSYVLSSETEISLVVFANLNLIDRNLDYLFTEELKNDILFALKDVKYISSINSIQKGLDNAYSKWSYETVDPLFYSEKYSAFKINFTAVLNGECYDPIGYNQTYC